MPEFGGIHQINNLDNWQGSHNTGSGYIDIRKHKKDQDHKDQSDQDQPEPEIKRDPDGHEHIDTTA